MASDNVNPEYAKIQGLIDKGELTLTPRDRELIDSSGKALSTALNGVRREDYKNHGWDGMDPHVLPLPQNPADVQAIANIHPRRAR